MSDEEWYGKIPEWAIESGITIVPVNQIEDVQTMMVETGPELIAAQDFIKLAGAHSALIYVRKTEFDAEEFAGEHKLTDNDESVENAEARPAIAELKKDAHRLQGRTFAVELCFVGRGVVHHWDYEAEWFRLLQSRAEATVSGLLEPGDESDDDLHSLTHADRERIAALLLDNREFRACKTKAQIRVARKNCPRLDELWRAGDLHEVQRTVQLAADLVIDGANEIYAELRPRYPELAATFAKDKRFLSAKKVSVREWAAEQFLSEHADGFLPNEVDRDLFLGEPPLDDPKAARSAAAGETLFG